MARVDQILARRWPNNRWRIANASGTDQEAYDTLTWEAGNPDPQPSLAEIQAQSASVDAELADEAQRRAQADKLMDREDAILAAFEILADFSAQLATSLRAQSLNTPLNTTRLQALRSKLAAIRPQ